MTTTPEPLLAPEEAESPTPAPGQTPQQEHRHLRRRPDDGLVGGVCAGVADYLRVDPLIVRVFFIIIALASGIGLAVYPLAWVLIPAAAVGAVAYDQRTWRDRLNGWGEAISIVLLAGIVVLLLRRAGLWLGDQVVLPLVLASCGVALILREASTADARDIDEVIRGPASAGTAPAQSLPRWRRWPGGVLGAALVFGAGAVFLGETGLLSRPGHKLGAILVVGVALGLVFGPWLAGLARSLASERAERVRSQERAEVAVHLHDSVLQTLALIQRRADDPREVAGLARRQERELRHWLLDRSEGTEAATLRAALEQAAAEVEDLYRVRVESVTVGDCPLDERLLATVSAAREALINAAKFAGGEQIDLFAEVTGDSVQVFVRDRGVGFDPAAIPLDRRGVRHSILERMQQHGGRAEVRSEPGRGTEVELVMERRPT